MNSILLIEDSKDFQILVTQLLGNHRVHVVDDPDKVKETVQQNRYDLILLDITLPKRDGYTVLSELQSDPATAGIPVICLTGKQGVTDKVTAFSLGADDFIQKPFDVLEFKARIESKLIKSKKNQRSKNVIYLSQILIHLDTYRVESTSGKEIDLTLTEFKLVVALSRNPGNVYSRDQLISSVWGNSVDVIDRTVDVHISSLRKKLQEYGIHFKSIPGVGYKLLSDDQSLKDPK